MTETMVCSYRKSHKESEDGDENANVENGNLENDEIEKWKQR